MKWERVRSWHLGSRIKGFRRQGHGCALSALAELTPVQSWTQSGPLLLHPG